MDQFETMLKQTFLEEAAQMLADNEQNFLALESGENPQGVIEGIFRLVHSFKGSAGAAGFDGVARLAHHLESLLIKVKKGEVAVHADLVDVLLRCNDQLVTMVRTLREDHGAQFELSELVVAIERAGSAPERVEAPPAVATQAFGFFDDEPPQKPAPIATALEPAAVAPLTIAKPEASGPARPSEPTKPAKARSDDGASAQAHGAPERTIRVAQSRLDKLIDNVGELVILQTVLNGVVDEHASQLLKRTLSQLDKTTKEIRDISMSLRMVSLNATFQKMHRIIRDTSKALGKEIDLKLTGEDAELDKTVLEQISDPLVHLVRNAVDHGVETPQSREEAGKSRRGTVHLKAYYTGSHIAIEVGDDGAGIDPDRIQAKAVEKGLIRPDQRLSRAEALELIFAPGFSSKDVVTDISGRGVGMDVVKTNIEALRGEVKIESTAGKGTCFTILLPLTLAIVDGMLLSIGEEHYVVPVTNVFECVKPLPRDLSTVTGTGEVMTLRGETLPLFRLGTMLGRPIKSKPADQGIVIVVRDAKHPPFGVVVDDIIAKQQIVIKRLGQELQNYQGVIGGAILGDGRAALIVDFSELYERYWSQHRPPVLKEAV